MVVTNDKLVNKKCRIGKLFYRIKENFIQNKRLKINLI